MSAGGGRSPRTAAGWGPICYPPQRTRLAPASAASPNLFRSPTNRPLGDAGARGRCPGPPAPAAERGEGPQVVGVG